MVLCMHRAVRSGPEPPHFFVKKCHYNKPSLFEATTTFLPIFTNSEARPSDRLAATWPQLTELKIGSNSLKTTLPSVQSTKVPQQPILITENEGEKIFPRFARNDRPYAPLSRCLRQRHCFHLSAAPPLGSFRRP